MIFTQEKRMAIVQYNCDACGADFEIDPKDPKFEYGVFCPECGETEIIKPLSEECCSDENAQAKPVRR
jgi:DNA-directed RNA polymerase subunit RPC12/RpoP